MNLLDRKFFMLLAMWPCLLWAGDDNDFGTWLELGAEKALPYNTEIGLEAELRTQEGNSQMDRYNIGLTFGYKPHKYLKLGVGYSFVMDYNAEKYGKKWLTPSHWKHRNRFWLEASSGHKFRKWLRLSGRLRYQFTRQAGKHLDRFECEGRDAETGEWIYDMDYPETKYYEVENRQVLRSRIKLEVDKKHLKWKPFVSTEFHNNVMAGEKMHFDKLRSSAGTGYKINRQHEVGLAYTYTLNRMKHPYRNMHALNASYKFSF